MTRDNEPSEIFQQMMEFTFDAPLKTVKPQTGRRVDIISLEDSVVVVVVMYEYTEDQISVDVYEHKGRKVLEIEAEGFSRAFFLAEDMSGKIDKGFRNGILEVIVYRDSKEEE